VTARDAVATLTPARSATSRKLAIRSYVTDLHEVIKALPSNHAAFSGLDFFDRSS
jgi:hypothetical protein